MFNLAYWDIFKNYYANKQEENAYVITGVDHIWKKIQIGDGYVWAKTWLTNSGEQYNVTPTNEKPQFIKLEFEEKISPEEVNEIQFLTNNPYTPTIESNGITKLGDTFILERTEPNAPGLKEPENPRKATNIYMYKIKKDIKFAYKISTNGRNLITMPDNQKIKLTEFPLKNIDDERTKILAAPSTSAYIVNNGDLPYGAATGPMDLPNYRDWGKSYTEMKADRSLSTARCQ